MIDRTKPAPGWQPPRMVKGRWRSGKTTVVADNRMQADCIDATHRIYAEESRPAVVDFAETVETWRHSEACTAAWYADTDCPNNESREDFVWRHALAHAQGVPLPGTEPPTTEEDTDSP